LIQYFFASLVWRLPTNHSDVVNIYNWIETQRLHHIKRTEQKRRNQISPLSSESALLKVMIVPRQFLIVALDFRGDGGGDEKAQEAANFCDCLEQAPFAVRSPISDQTASWSNS
jgi:hypothetical protein